MLRNLMSWEINQQFRDMKKRLAEMNRFDATNRDVFLEVSHGVKRTTFFLSVADPNGKNGPVYNLITDKDRHKWLVCFSSPDEQTRMGRYFGVCGEMAGLNRILELLAVFDDLSGVVVDPGHGGIVLNRVLLEKIRSNEVPKASAEHSEDDVIVEVGPDGSIDYDALRI